ncbi:MAG: leucine-rich repeat domain-containing protein [Spirochaetaceae bacterium]|jgi:hypothetical protein|nr:leucine-rich repeat domain-containing protein [Spirochaetaceae bacterium]
MRGALPALAALAVLAVLPLRGEESGAFEFKIEIRQGCAKGAVITRFRGGLGRVVIPADLGGAPVTAIGPEAFFEARGITSLEIPPSVTRIGEGAFFGCVNLAEAALPPALRVIPERAFYGCIRLERVEIPPSVEVIGKDAFAYCRRLSLPWDA